MQVRTEPHGATETGMKTRVGPIAPRHGVVTVCGYGITIRVERGHLIIDDGIGTDRRHARFPRVGHGVKRPVIVGSGGMVSLAALRWLSDQGASFGMLGRDGSVLATTGPVRPSEARLRLAQARALSNETALVISKELISAKLLGQETVARDKMKNSAAADAIAGFRVGLDTVEDLDSIRMLEAREQSHIGIRGAVFRCFGLSPICAEFPTIGARSAREQVRLRAALGSP